MVELGIGEGTGSLEFVGKIKSIITDGCGKRETARCGYLNTDIRCRHEPVESVSADCKTIQRIRLHLLSFDLLRTERTKKNDNTRVYQIDIYLRIFAYL